MSKKDEILTFLYNKILYPVVNSSSVSPSLKGDFSDALTYLNEFSAEGLLFYFWSTLGNDEIARIYMDHFTDKGLKDLNCSLKEFKNRFTYEWLRS